MSKRKPAVGTSAAEAHLAMVEENNRQMREKASPLVRGMMDEVDAAIAEENKTLDAQFEGDARLRAWAKDLLGFEISMSQIEDLKEKIQSIPKGKTFVYANVALIRTQFDTVDRAERYLFALEKTLIDLSSKKVEKVSISAEPPKDQYTELSSLDLIKLAFKRLFKRSK